MTDTLVPVVAANAINTSLTGVGVVIFGMHTGLDYQTLIAGVFGGALALSYLDPAHHLKRAAQVVSASLLAGYSSPVFADVGFGALKKLSLVSDSATTPFGLQLLMATVIGYLAHGVILPGLRTIGTAIVRRHSSG